MDYFTFTGVLEATVYDGSQQFRLEEKISETRRMYRYVAAFHCRLLFNSVFCSVCLLFLRFFLVVVQQFTFNIVVGRHFWLVELWG